MKNYNLTEALNLVKYDYVLTRKTDGVSISNSDFPGGRVIIGHVVDELPIRIEIDAAHAASILADNGDNVWTLAPAA